MKKQSDITLLPDIFERYPKIQAVYLFGSIAGGRSHEESDLDLAVFLEDDNPPHLKLDILSDLAREGFCNVDLVFMNTNDIVLKYEAVRQNRLVYQRYDFDHRVLYSNIIRQYLDFVPYLEVQRQAYKKRILNDTTGSNT